MEIISKISLDLVDIRQAVVDLLASKGYDVILDNIEFKVGRTLNPAITATIDLAESKPAAKVIKPTLEVAIENAVKHLTQETTAYTDEMSMGEKAESAKEQAVSSQELDDLITETEIKEEVKEEAVKVVSGGIPSGTEYLFQAQKAS